MARQMRGSRQHPTRTICEPQRKIFGRGYTLTAIAEATNIPLSTISAVTTGKARWANVQKAIAEAIGMTPPALFGDLCHPSLRRSPIAGSEKQGAAA